MAMTLAAQPDNLRRYVAEVTRHPLLSREEETSLAIRLRDTGDVGAAHALVVSNLRFVVRVAQGFRGYGLKLLDLIQEGNIGLMLAVKKFDPSRGYRLITYAVWWIRAYMQNFIMKSWSLVRMGASRIQRKLFFKLRAERERAHKAGELGPTGEVDHTALAERLGAEVAEVDEVSVRLAARDFALDAPHPQSGDATYLDGVADGGPTPEEEVAGAEECAHLRAVASRAMATLTDQERAVLSRRVLADEPESLQQLGTDFQVTRERIRQVELKLTDKLRAAYRAEAGPEDAMVPTVAPRARPARRPAASLARCA